MTTKKKHDDEFEEVAAHKHEPEAPVQHTTPELAKVQEQAQKLPDWAEAQAKAKPAGRVSESSQDAFEEEQNAGREAVADAVKAGKAQKDGK